MKHGVARAILCLTIGVILVAGAGCSDEDPVVPAGDPGPRTAAISIVAREGCTICDPIVVFTSALDGTLLDDGLTTGDVEFDLEIPSEPGAGFYLTRVAWMSGDIAFIETEYYVVIENLALEFEYGPPGPFGTFALRQFTNIPEHDRYTIDSGRVSISGVSLPNQLQIPILVRPADLLLSLDLADGSRSHLWLENVDEGPAQMVDLVGLEPMLEHEVALPAVTSTIYCGASGIAEDSRQYQLTSEFLEVPVPENCRLNFIPDAFENYRTAFRTELSSSLHRTATTQTEGALPATVEFWDATLDILSATPDSFLALVDADVEELRVTWSRGPIPSPAQTIWSIESPAPDQALVLPALPASMAELAPDLIRDDLEPHVVEASRQIAGTAADGTSMVVTQRVVVFPDREDAGATIDVTELRRHPVAVRK